MIRRRINQNSVQGKRFQVSDVPDLSTPKGIAKENDEMRKLAMDLNSFADEVQGKISDVAAAIPAPTTLTTTTGPGVIPDKPKEVKLPILEVWQDGLAVVVGTRVWNFAESDSIRFEVTNDGNQIARIQAFTLRSLNTMWGRFSGGYAVEVPNTNGKTIDIYGNNPTYSQPYTVQRNRSLIHWVGDASTYEPALQYESVSGTNQRKGFNIEKPSQELAAWTSYTQGLNVNGRSYDVTTVKARVTPQLQFFDPDESVKTTEHVTRVFMKDSATITPHVTIDNPVPGSTQFPYLNIDPRLYTAALSFDIKDDAYAMQNLGSPGVYIGDVYKERIGRTFYLRRIRATGSLSLSQDDNYITISGMLTSGGGTNLYDAQNNGAPGLNVYTGSVGTNPTTFVFRPITVAGDLSIYQDTSFDRIVISGSDTTYTIRADNAPVGAYLSLVGDDSSIDQVQFVGVSGTTVTRQDDNTILISSSPIQRYYLSNCASGTGTGLVYHDSTVSGNDTTYNLRTIAAGTGIAVTTSGHNITITNTVVDTNNTYDIDNCALGTGTGLIYHDSTISGSNTSFHLRKLLAGNGMQITTSGHDILVTTNASLTDTKYDMFAQPDGSDARITLSGTDGTTDFVRIVASGSADVEYIDPQTIRISATDTNNTYTVANCASGTGDGLVYAYTDTIGSQSNVYLRRIKAGLGTTVTVSGCDVIVGSSYDAPRYYNVDAACSGYVGPIAYLQSGTRGTGDTLLDPLTFQFRGIVAGSGIVIDNSDPCAVTIGRTIDLSQIYTVQNVGTNTISGTGFGNEVLANIYAGSTTASGVTTFNLRRLQSFDYHHGVGVYATQSYVDSNTIELKTRFANWNTTHDTTKFLDDGTEVLAKVLAHDTWEDLYFSRVNIMEPAEPLSYVPTNNRVIKTPSFYFQPNIPADYNGGGAYSNVPIFNVAVRLYVSSRYPTSNTVAASLAYPQIAIFLDGVFYRELAVDARVGEYAAMRQALLESSVISSTLVPESGSKAWLHGCALVQIPSGVKMSIGFKHLSGASRYILLKEGSIDIMRAGLNNILQAANAPHINYASL